MRLVLIGAGCAGCGRPYGVEGVRVLAQREEIAFVQFACSTCHTQTLALVTGLDALVEEGAEPTDDALPTGAGPADGSSISEADVRDMHAFLAGYRGDLRTLLER